MGALRPQKRCEHRIAITTQRLRIMVNSVSYSIRPTPWRQTYRDRERPVNV